jgi:hypothetical protein
MLREDERNAQAHLVKRMKAFVLLTLVVGLTAARDAFAEPKPSFAYEYGVRGKGENVRVTYPTQPAGLVHETVTLPWTSGEFEGPDEFIRMKRGPAGTRVTCVVRYRQIEATYGGGGSGSASQQNSPDDPTRCALKSVMIP